jgi:Fur family iron response transcriptional regulator
MSDRSTNASAYSRLKAAKLRPTKQRLGLSQLLFGGENRHIKAETLHSEAQSADISVSLATVYNTLHQFTRAGLLRQISVDGTSTYFDTNLDPHHHLYLADEERLIDIPTSGFPLSEIPNMPEGTEIEHVEVIVRARKSQ